ncbi:MAG: DUF423 domain-containing protein [Flavobacteriales bacterium]|nr:DUF423 domain-containing protein [Flavobacteriales bacterium]MBL6873068.1 DUF423 domain-containing protein [Flavobacteriales bacterium]
MNKKVLLIANCLIILGIILDAFSAHALKKLISFEQLQSFKVGTKYHLFHSLALLILGLNYSKLKLSKTIIALFISGIICFSFSIYFLSIQNLIGMDLKFLGPITPIGGLLFILSWIFVFTKMMSIKQNS